MLMIMDLHVWARMPNVASPGKFGENHMNTFKCAQEAELVRYQHMSWEN